MTPLQFYADHVPTDVDRLVSVVHDPRNEYGKLYTVDRLGNVPEGYRVRYLNLPMDKVKALAHAQLKRNEPVWFGCEVGRELHRTVSGRTIAPWLLLLIAAMASLVLPIPQLGILDNSMYDYSSVLGLDLTMSKADRLRHGDSAMDHAMVLTGFHELEEKKTEGSPEGVTRWRVQNSWGETGSGKGYLSMTDEWFSEYVYQVGHPFVAPSTLASDHWPHCIGIWYSLPCLLPDCCGQGPPAGRIPGGV